MPELRDRVKELRRVPASQLIVSEKNWRKHPTAQSKALRRLIDEVGFASAVIAREDADGRCVVIDGHLRRDITGDEVVPVLVLDVNEREADLLLATMDPLAAMAQADGDALAALLASLPKPHTDLEALYASLQRYLPGTPVVDPEPPPLPAEATTKPGDRWVLGRHYLVCGDARDAEVCRYATNGDTAHSLVTDPPYGVDYSSKNEMLNRTQRGNRNQTPIQNDALTGQALAELFKEFLDAAPLARVNTAYVFMGGSTLHLLRAAFELAGYTFSQYLIWVKNNHVLGRTDYAAKNEFVLYGWKGTHRFYGKFSPTVLEFDRPQRSVEHPTMKPVALCAKLIEDGSPEGGLVFDPFAGSGSTLIACEQTRRACASIEIDPRYCDVIVQRWAQLTGGEPRRG